MKLQTRHFTLVQPRTLPPAPDAPLGQQNARAALGASPGLLAPFRSAPAPLWMQSAAKPPESVEELAENLKSAVLSVVDLANVDAQGKLRVSAALSGGGPFVKLGALGEPLGGAEALVDFGGALDALSTFIPGVQSVSLAASSVSYMGGLMAGNLRPVPRKLGWVAPLCQAASLVCKAMGYAPAAEALDKGATVAGLLVTTADTGYVLWFDKPLQATSPLALSPYARQLKLTPASQA